MARDVGARPYYGQTNNNQINMAMKHLSKGSSNAKTSKNNRETLILYMSPAKQNSTGRNLCPKASPGCLAACLYTAGRGAFSNVQSARMRKSELFIHDTESFLSEIAAQINSEAKKHKELAVRMNGTSDTKIVYMLTKKHDIDPRVVFYDYTKIRSRAGDHRLDSGHRYMVAFSRSEKNNSECIDVLESGGVVAAVFATIPKKWYGYKVIDGDSRDDLMLDVKGGVVLGLKAKGRAKSDKTGFVIQ